MGGRVGIKPVKIKSFPSRLTPFPFPPEFKTFIVPIYAYKCSACGHAEDKLQKMSDAPLTLCPQCAQSTYSKQVTAAGFQLKGSGWYVTDFRSNGNGGAKASEAAAPVDSAPGAAGTTSESGAAGDSGGKDKPSSSDASAGQSSSSSESSAGKSSAPAPSNAPNPSSASSSAAANSGHSSTPSSSGGA